MKKNRFNEKFREYSRDVLSPKIKEREFVSKVYSSFQKVLGENNSIQIGSYPRFTAITPLHDLDILYISGKWEKTLPNPTSVLKELAKEINSNYINPTPYEIEVSEQTHSITIQFLHNKEEIFSVDLVPAYIYSNNEFGENTYLVPEIISKRHSKRREFYETLQKSHSEMGWIKSDPRGYIKVATLTDTTNNDFRKTVKFIKAWRNSCKEYSDEFKLKSFHIEQIVTAYFSNNAELEIFDAVFKFFHELPANIEKALIPDRADTSRKIDEYVDKLTDSERELIIQARDYFLIKLEQFSEESSVEDLVKAGVRQRASLSEKYLFDYGIPVLIEDKEFSIIGTALPRNGSFRQKILDAIGLIEIDRKIEFRIYGRRPEADVFKWKVKNDDKSPEPRGEINDDTTFHDPEYTQYNGTHFVECYAIRSGVCIARSRQNVILRSIYTR